MKYFKVLTADETGKKEVLMKTAVSEELLLSSLTEQGYYVIGIKEQKKGELFSRRMGNQQGFTLDFIYQIATLLDFGLDIHEVCRILMKVYDKEEQREFVSKLTSYMEKGDIFSQALEKADRYRLFSDFYRIMIQSGEKSGNLAYTFQLLNTYAKSMYKVKEEVVSASIYPGIILIFSAVSLLALFFFILPNFKMVYENMDFIPPLLIRVLFRLSDFCLSYWLVMLVVGVIAVASMVLLMRYGRYRNLFFSMLKKLPLVSKVIFWENKIRLSFCLEVLLKGGSTLEEGLYTLKGIEKDPVLVKELEQMYEAVKGGERLSKVFSLSRYFSRQKDLSLIEISESISRTDSCFAKITEDSMIGLEQYTKRILKLMEPVLMVAIGLFVFLIMYIVMSPTLEILNSY